MKNKFRLDKYAIPEKYEIFIEPDFMLQSALAKVPKSKNVNAINIFFIFITFL